MDDTIYKNFMNELADLSGNYIRSEFGKKHSIDSKEDSSPVTIVDKNTEELLREKISKKFPNHGIIGEEFGNTNTDAEYVWVLDPIDGTKSFITGVPLFGTLIGLMKNKDYYMGVIDQPILKERCFGDNNVCLFNGQKTLADTAQKTLKGSRVMISDTRQPRISKRSMTGWQKLEDEAAILRSWGDCYGYMLVCRGLAHVMLDPILEIWDLAALVPCMKGAGASVSDWFGGTNFGHEGGFVSACTPELLSETIKTINLK